MRRLRPPTATAFLALLLLLAGCGGEPQGDAEGGPSASGSPVALPALPPVSDAEKAAFALDRLLTGPLRRTAAFRIPQIHLLNLEHARADLVALGEATTELLAEPRRIARITRPEGDHNPWHNILQVLPRLPGLSADLALAWCRPALNTDDLQLDRRAVRALAAVEDGRAVAPELLALFRRRTKDREAGPQAFRALVRLGSPWREQVVETALRGGGGLLWSHVPAELQAAAREDARAGDALAWWALLAESTGPLELRGTARNVPAAWYRGRLLIDDAVWPQDLAALQAAALHGRVLAPARVLDPEGYLPLPADASPVLPWRQALPSGRGAAADARCRLAEAGFAAFASTVTRDRSATDPLLRLTAEGCALATQDVEETLELQRIVLDSFLEDLEAAAAPEPTGVLPALAAVLEATPEAGRAAARRILEDARPQAAYQELLEGAHDLLARADPDALAAVLDALGRQSDPEDRATALLLVRRGRDPRHAALLDTLLETASDAEAPLLQRLLIWIQTAPEGVTPAMRRAFAKRYAGWVDVASDAEARGLAPGLLDLGPEGAAVYAEGLRRPRRSVYVRGLLGRSGLVAPVVAAALLDPVDATTAPSARRAVLVAAYRVAPTEAAPHVAALRARLAEADRAEVDDVLAVVRHRADRPPPPRGQVIFFALRKPAAAASAAFAARPASPGPRRERSAAGHTIPRATWWIRCWA